MIEGTVLASIFQKSGYVRSPATKIANGRINTHLSTFVRRAVIGHRSGRRADYNTYEEGGFSMTSTLRRYYNTMSHTQNTTTGTEEVVKETQQAIDPWLQLYYCI